MELNDWKNLMNIAKRGFYENNYDYFDDENINDVTTFYFERDSLNKFDKQYGGKYSHPDALNIILDYYIDMKGGSITKRAQKTGDKIKAQKREIGSKFDKIVATVTTLKYGRNYDGITIAQMSRDIKGAEAKNIRDKLINIFKYIEEMLEAVRLNWTLDKKYIKEFKKMLEDYKKYVASLGFTDGKDKLKYEAKSNYLRINIADDDELNYSTSRIINVFEENLKTIASVNINYPEIFRKILSYSNKILDKPNYKIPDIKKVYENFIKKLENNRATIIDKRKELRENVKQSAITNAGEIAQTAGNLQQDPQSPDTPSKPLPESLDMYDSE